MQKLVLYGMVSFPTVSNDNFASSNGNLIGGVIILLFETAWSEL